MGRRSRARHGAWKLPSWTKRRRQFALLIRRTSGPLPYPSPACGVTDSKLHNEREQRRPDDKDALDILRLLQATETSVLAATVIRLLQADVARDITREALLLLRDLLTHPRAAGSQMAAREVATLMSARRNRSVVCGARI
jgi:hypothetical protein